MASRVVRPESRRIDISNGDWLLVKKRLNHGDKNAAFARKYVTDPAGARVNLLQHTGMAQITAYLLDWSLTDPDDKQIVIRDQPIEVIESALNSIDPESFDEINTAIEAHEAAINRELAEQKKILAGTSKPALTSSSPSAAAGALTGSVS